MRLVASNSRAEGPSPLFPVGLRERHDTHETDDTIGETPVGYDMDHARRVNLHPRSVLMGSGDDDDSMVFDEPMFMGNSALRRFVLTLFMSI